MILNDFICSPTFFSQKSMNKLWNTVNILIRQQMRQPFWFAVDTSGNGSIIAILSSQHHLKYHRTASWNSIANWSYQFYNRSFWAELWIRLPYNYFCYILWKVVHKHNFETYCFGIIQIRIVFFKKKTTSSKKSFLLESRHYNYTNYCQFLPPLGNEKQKYFQNYDFVFTNSKMRWTYL